MDRYSDPQVRTKAIAKAKKWREDNPVRFKYLMKRHGKRNPEKKVARKKVENALKSGELTRPEFCDNCRDNCYVEGHHEDYSKPLDVEWLCRTCHYQIHRLNKVIKDQIQSLEKIMS